MIKVASVQLDIKDEEAKEARLARVEGILAGLKGYALVLLPEVWNIGYFSFDRYASESETLEGETPRRMAEAARRLGAYLHMGSFVQRDGDSLFNTSLLFNPQGRILASYRKLHLFGYGSKEVSLLKPGKEVVTVKTELGVIGLSTCYDLRFPELYRRQVEAGAELFLVTSAWPYPRLEAWQVLNRARALENLAFLVSSNCVGQNGGSRLLGHSAIVDPWGTVLAGARDEETVLKAELDLGAVARARSTFPALRDRVLY